MLAPVRRLVIVPLLLSALVGCRARPPVHMVVGPFHAMPSAALWERTLATLRGAGYTPDRADPAFGQITVPSHAFGDRQSFLIRLYREGWVQVGLASQETAQYWKPRIPPELTREQVELTIRLREGLEAPASTSGGEEEEEPSS